MNLLKISALLLGLIFCEFYMLNPFAWSLEDPACPAGQQWSTLDNGCMDSSARTFHIAL